MLLHGVPVCAAVQNRAAESIKAVVSVLRRRVVARRHTVHRGKNPRDGRRVAAHCVGQQSDALAVAQQFHPALVAHARARRVHRRKHQKRAVVRHVQRRQVVDDAAVRRRGRARFSERHELDLLLHRHDLLLHRRDLRAYALRARRRVGLVGVFLHLRVDLAERIVEVIHLDLIRLDPLRKFVICCRLHALSPKF